MIVYILDAVSQNFNPRPPRGGRRLSVHGLFQAREISIHAPREGGDGGITIGNPDVVSISIHAPREGGDW